MSRIAYRVSPIAGPAHGAAMPPPRPAAAPSSVHACGPLREPPRATHGEPPQSLLPGAPGAGIEPVPAPLPSPTSPPGAIGCAPW